MTCFTAIALFEARRRTSKKLRGVGGLHPFCPPLTAGFQLPTCAQQRRILVESGNTRTDTDPPASGPKVRGSRRAHFRRKNLQKHGKYCVPYQSLGQKAISPKRANPASAGQLISPSRQIAGPLIWEPFPDAPRKVGLVGKAAKFVSFHFTQRKKR